jgi:hypothetical protein
MYIHPVKSVRPFEEEVVNDQIHGQNLEIKICSPEYSQDITNIEKYEYNIEAATIYQRNSITG